MTSNLHICHIGEPQLLNFNPYQVAEISAIIKDRLYSLDPNSKPGSSPLPLMQPPAVELCARKVAAAMGDLRTALDVCRQAVELAETEHKRKTVLADQKQPGATTEIVKVSIGHVMKVLQTVFGSPVVQKLKQLGLQQKVVICVLMAMSCSSSSSSSHKKEHITLGRVSPYSLKREAKELTYIHACISSSGKNMQHSAPNRMA